MKISLNGLKKLHLSPERNAVKAAPEGWVELKVSHCAICRSDAKMWSEGHRDLHLPRVPGHEIVALKENVRYVIWPGIACGECSFCKEGNENLCDDMEIIGFHRDGGFSDVITVPFSCLIPVPEELSSPVATFAEPAGCIVNAFRKIDLAKDDRLLIYGAGTVGILTAMLALQYGARPTIIEKNETKIRKALVFSEKGSFDIVKTTEDSRFNCILNACSDPTAFMAGIPKTAKGARIVFFSGLDKNEQIESNLLNLVHYKELSINGSYGLTKIDMINGLALIGRIHASLESLIESTISPAEVEILLPSILAGERYKYIIDFSEETKARVKNLLHHRDSTPLEQSACVQSGITDNCSIAKPSEDLRAEAQEKIDNKTKPLGALGILEELAVKMSLIQNSLNPEISSKSLFVFAADHGIAEEGVSAFPQEVTRQMVQNFLNGGAAINALSRHNNINLSIIDIGVKGPITVNSNHDLIHKRIAEGTRNFALERAMTKAEALRAIEAGAEVFRSQYESGKIDILGLGEMGIANTTTATAIISTITGVSPAECTGRGTGIDDQGLDHKIKVLEKALTFHNPDKDNALDILSCVGGFEIAGMAGAALAAAEKGCAIVLDGLISTAAGLIAFTLDPDVIHYFIAGHKSVEVGHEAALNHMGLTAVLDLNMRLGEGTGAALTIDITAAACRIMREMASFDEAGVAGKE
ncbi:MAG: nicotinate-nucleotide--dimethylbenzimidazole phosphoribosyltransferase [Candidatus Sabulitectum sp.]|nr:nicotinate-nucleotide--dimethylbenzimidazole phosphoribosyltransferase [Candidatus Sabulitectum sp.]